MHTNTHAFPTNRHPVTKETWPVCGWSQNMQAQSSAVANTAHEQLLSLFPIKVISMPITRWWKTLKNVLVMKKQNQFGESGGCILTVLFCTLWWGPPMHQWVLEQCTVHFFFWRSSINTSLALRFDPQLGHSHERSDWLDVIIVMQNCMFFFFSDKGNESAKGAGVQLIQHCSCGSCEFNWTGVFVLHRTTCTDYQHNCSLYSVLATRNCFFSGLKRCIQCAFFETI